ncbi:hypothetical protein ACJX0J_019541 [Zea mays]
MSTMSLKGGFLDVFWIQTSEPYRSLMGYLFFTGTTPGMRGMPIHTQDDIITLATNLGPKAAKGWLIKEDELPKSTSRTTILENIDLALNYLPDFVFIQTKFTDFFHDPDLPKDLSQDLYEFLATFEYVERRLSVLHHQIKGN